MSGFDRGRSPVGNKPGSVVVRGVRPDGAAGARVVRRDDHVTQDEDNEDIPI